MFNRWRSSAKTLTGKQLLSDLAPRATNLFKSAPEGGGGTTLEEPVEIEFQHGSLDAFGRLYVAGLNNQIDVQFYRADPEDLVTVTTGDNGTATGTGGQAIFAATDDSGSFATGISNETTFYSAGAEIYCLFTAAFLGTGAGDNFRRIGLFDSADGFFIGYEADTFGFTLRKGGSDTQVAQASWSADQLSGADGSLFTRAGTTEAVDLSLLNVWRISFGWVGSAPITLSVLSPDGKWVKCHEILQPNLSDLPSIENADLPFTCDVNAGTAGEAISIATDCWSAGTSAAQRKINSPLTDESFGVHSRSILAGKDYLTQTYQNISSVKLQNDAVALVMIPADFNGNPMVVTANADDLDNSVPGIQTTTFNYVFDGAAWDRAPGNSTDGALVKITSGTVDVTGSVVDVTGSTVAAVVSGSVDVDSVPADPFGANADAASATGSISAKLRALATAFGITALDLGSGTGGSRTLRVATDTDPFGVTADAASASGSISAKLRGIATALGITALDLSPGTGGSRTLRVAVDTVGVVQRKDVIPIVVTSTALTTSVTNYLAGDAVGAEMAFANAARVSGGGGRIIGATLNDAKDIVGAYDVVLANATITPAANNDPASFSAADGLKIVGLIQLAGPYDLGLTRLAISYTPTPYYCAATTLFAYLITRSSHVFFGATTDLQLTLYFERD